MDRKQLADTRVPPAVSTNIPIFSPLISFVGEPGQIPRGTVITVTGDPGTGKTRYVLQVLRDIQRWNEKTKPKFYSYEQTPAALNHVLNAVDPAMDLKGQFEFSIEPEFIPNAVVGIDSLDAWAMNFHNSSYPTAKMATTISKAQKEDCIVFQIHHKVKGQKSESGSAHFARNNDITIELLKQNDGSIVATTRRKNRHPGEVDQVILEHTSRGLKVREEKSIWGLAQNFWTRLIN